MLSKQTTTYPGASLAGKGSIGSPASAKNAIAVGASLSSRSPRPLLQGPVLSARAITPLAMERLRIAGPSTAVGPAISLMVLNVSYNAPGYSLLQADKPGGGGGSLSALPADVVELITASRLWWLGVCGIYHLTIIKETHSPITHRLPRIMFATPSHGCQTPASPLLGRVAPDAPPRPPTNAVLVVEVSANGSSTGGCNIDARLRAAQQAGAAALLVAADSSGFGFPLSAAFQPSRNASTVLPVGGIPWSTLLLLQRMAAEAGGVVLQVDGVAVDTSDTHMDVAYFSAFGPTYDGVYAAVCMGDCTLYHAHPHHRSHKARHSCGG